MKNQHPAKIVHFLQYHKITRAFCVLTNYPGSCGVMSAGGRRGAGARRGKPPCPPSPIAMKRRGGDNADNEASGRG